MIKSISSSGAQVNTTYDSMGRVASTSNPFQSGGSPQYWTAFQYDTLGRATVMTLPDNNTLQTSYSGLTVTTTDQVNRKMKRETDSLGRLVKVTEQDSSGTLSQDTSYTYDLLDRLTEVNQGNQLRKYKYDGLGRLLYERIPEQTATINDGTGVMWSCKYTYTTFNAVATKTDARGVVTTYGYDTMNRLTGISYNVSGASGVASTPGVIYQYDNTQSSSTTGLLMSVFVGSGATVAGGSEENYSYDSLGRVSSLQRRINVSPSVIRSYTSSYQYNDAGQTKQISYPSGRLIQPSYDNAGRLASLSGSANYVSSVGYDTIGRVSGMTMGNGVVESYGYDSQRMQMTSQTATRSGNTLMSLTYGFQASAGQMGVGSTAGNAGQLMSVSGSIGGQTESAAYTYDLLGRLVTSNQTTNSVSAQRRFVYDRWGNRTAVYDATTGGNQIQSVTLDQSGGVPTNRITSVTSGGTVNYTYDAAGNVTSDGAHSYTYDAENRLVSVDGGATATYAYDHVNRRIKKTIAGVTTHCVWKGSQVIAENNAASGSVNVEYIYSGSRMVASIAGGVTRYYLADRLSARVTLDTSGNIIGRQAHLPFGEELNTSGTTDKHRFTSYERDNETGLDYAVNREYSFASGRFLSVDKVAGLGSRPQRLNRFAYTRNDPANRTDPLGLDDCPPQPCPPDHRWDREYCDCIPVLHGEDDYPDEPGWEPGPGVQPILNIAWFLDPAESGYGEEPPAEPYCRLGVEISGQMGGHVPLRFPSNHPNLGPVETRTAWTYNVHIWASVSESERLGDWIFDQTVTGWQEWSGFYDSTGNPARLLKARVSSNDPRYGRERFNEKTLYKPGDETWMFAIDSPGLARKIDYNGQAITITDGELQLRFRTSIRKGGRECGVIWSYHLKVVDRRVTINQATIVGRFGDAWLPGY